MNLGWQIHRKRTWVIFLSTLQISSISAPIGEELVISPILTSSEIKYQKKLNIKRQSPATEDEDEGEEHCHSTFTTVFRVFVFA